ncbi:hypothetical protein ED733_001563 [Metarhizium rileyi]|uniref:U3 snoRNA associated n=1 Tax=Metarhizium rileyi (strain RCEF 4871) TaxID=1649241 RepID=A0A5C6GFM9_METRR|nr:hypothetical protein ED733_001563 [Metarhizium rileyi]
MPVETRKRKAMAQAVLESAEPTPTRSTSTTKRQRKLVLRSKGDAPEAQAPEPASKKSNVIVFDDDGNADRELMVPSQPMEASEPIQQDEQSDSDEAPEAVSTARVAVEMKKSAQAEKKAARELAAVEKKKRQQRDALFKQQASERKVDAQSEGVTAPKKAASGRKRFEKLVIPSVLPAEFLTDSESDDEDSDMESSPGANRPRKRTVSAIEKRMSREGKGPRDETIGSTMYRVSKAVDTRLAPKARKHSRSSRDLLLKRGRAPVTGRSGFFKK